MGVNESVDRLKSTPKEDLGFYWWYAGDLKAWAARIVAADDKEIVRAVRGLNEQGHPDLHLFVGDPEREDGGTNFSHFCPPVCPNGNGG
jgi:hypothetical protein